MTESQKRIAELTPEQRDLLLRRLSERRKNNGQQGPDIVRRSRGADSEAPLSYAQEREWFLDLLYPGNPAHNLAGALRLHGHLSESALSSTLNEIYPPHGTLRANFEAPSVQPLHT